MAQIGRQTVCPNTFFRHYWISARGLHSDEHFQTIFDMCQPCQVRYNYYGNFNTFEADAEVLIEQLGSDSSLLNEGYHNTKNLTSDVAPELYSLLSSYISKENGHQ